MTVLLKFHFISLFDEPADVNAEFSTAHFAFLKYHIN